MGDERRDFDNSGDTNRQQDQTPPQDDTQPTAPPDDTGPVAPPDETQPVTPSDQTQPVRPLPDETQPVAPSDQTQRVTPLPDETQPVTPLPDETQRVAPLGRRDETSVMPQDGAWSGRAGVGQPQGRSLRDSAPYTEQLPPAEQQKPWWTPALLGLLALGLLGVLILAAWWMGRDNEPAPVDSPTSAVIVPTTPAAPTTQPPPTTAASPTTQVVQVPRLVGMPQDQAVAQLDQLGLAYRFEYRPADEPEGTVIETKPREGQIVPVRTTVTLVVSTGREPPSPTPTPEPSITPT